MSAIEQEGAAFLIEQQRKHEERAKRQYALEEAAKREKEAKEKIAQTIPVEVEAYRCLADFETVMHHGMASFKKDEFITDPHLIAILKADGCPIAPAHYAKLTQCPNCSHTFAEKP